MKSGRHYAARSIKGARPYQEDDCGFNPQKVEGDEADELLLVLADGMGGHKGGAHASRTAVETFIDVFNSRSGAIADRLDRALDHANRQVGIDSETDPELEGMGCTLVAAYVAGHTLTWVSVGDSPLWVFRDGTLVRLNEDHSMGAVLDDQVRLGKLSQEAAAADPQRHALLSAVTGEPLSNVDGPTSVSLHPGDRLVLASDGVLTLTQDEMATLLDDVGALDADAAVQRLVDAVEAKKSPGQDNATVMVVDPAIPAEDPTTIEIPAGGKAPRATESRRPDFRRVLAALILLAILVGAGFFAYRHLVTANDTAGGDQPASGSPGTEDDTPTQEAPEAEPLSPPEPDRGRTIPAGPHG